MPVLAHLPYLFNAAHGQASIHTLRWQDRPLQCPHGQSHHIGRWGTYRYHPGCKNATGVIAAGAPATTGHLFGVPCLCIAAHGQGSGCPSPDQLSLVLGSVQCDPVLWRCSPRWRAQSTPMNSIPPLGRRAKPNRAGRTHWDAEHVDVARRASQGHYDKDRPVIIAWVSRQGGCRYSGDPQLHREDGAAGR